ncbi:zinc-binding dehydrogenase [Lentzea sp. NBC_00516]|uniref:zinc-binding dehydrogenase n=1 Tax=Lentzea sp. NBC_00516 TaxID=2903582 RepID=UPI003FA5C133
MLSAISLGTELAIVAGKHPAHIRGFDWRRGLFRASDQRALYPITSLGYMQTGVVIQPGLSHLSVGTRVAMAAGHRTIHIAADASSLIPLPNDLPDEAGVFVSTLGPVAANALLHAAVVEAGRGVDSLRAGVDQRQVVVLGGGAVGLLVAVLAFECGAESVLVVERDPWRRSVAESLGLETFDDSLHDAGVHFRSRWAIGPEIAGGADVAFQTRPTAAGVADALRSVRPGGVVVDLAFHTAPATELFLGDEFHHGSLWLVAAQVDRLPLGTETLWSRSRLSDETIRKLRGRPDVPAMLVTDRVPFAEAPEYFGRLASSSRRQLTPVLTF